MTGLKREDVEESEEGAEFKPWVATTEKRMIEQALERFKRVREILLLFSW